MVSSTAASSVRYDTQSIGPALRSSHAHWVSQARRELGGVLRPDADGWARWAAVRYLADAFKDQLEWERALVAELRPFLAADSAERLSNGGEQVGRLRLELDRVGRRRGSAVEFAGSARRLLEWLAIWCAEIELAACGIARTELPAEGAVVLAHLEALSERRDDVRGSLKLAGL